MVRDHRTRSISLLVEQAHEHIHELGESRDSLFALLGIDDKIKHEHDGFERAAFFSIVHQRLKLSVELALISFSVVAKHKLGNLFGNSWVFVDDLNQPAQLDNIEIG